LVLPAPARHLPLLPTTSSPVWNWVLRCRQALAGPFGTRGPGNDRRPGAFAPSLWRITEQYGDARYDLLELDGGAGGLEVLLELLGVFLRHAFLDVLRGAFDQVLGFLQAQAGDGADGLDDLDLLLAGRLQDDGELGLLLDGGSRASGGSHGDRRGGGDAELLFDGLDQLHHFHEGLAGDGFDDLLVGQGHCDYLLKCFLERDFGNRRCRLRGLGGCLGRRGFAATLLLADGLDGAGEHGDRLGKYAGQHGQGLVEGRQRGQDLDVARRVQLAANGDHLRLELVVGLGELLDQATGSAGLLGRERVKQRTHERILGALELRAFDGARGQRVLDNLQEHAVFAGLLAHRGQL